VDIKIYNILGELVYSTLIHQPSERIELELSELSAGIYTCAIQSNEALEIHKIIKEDL
jgi:hypothetical protein